MAETVSDKARSGTDLHSVHNPEVISELDDRATELNGLTDGTVPRTGRIKNTQNVGTAGTDVAATEYGDGTQHTTELALSAVSYSIAGAADEAIGAKIYTFPAGVHLHKVTYMDVALQGGGTVDSDTPDVGVGSVEATGVVAILGGTSTFEDYITGQTASDCNGTATVAMTGATAGILTDISLNMSGDVKEVWFNIACGWSGADTVEATGTVVLEWTTIA